MNCHFPVIAQIGDINVTATTVYTPSGTVALRGSQWTAVDQWVTERRTPQWAKVVAIAGVCFTALLSLLLLLVKEETYRASISVSVMSAIPSLLHSAADWRRPAAVRSAVENG